MEKKIKMVQPNQITNARYDFTAVQKNILYEILGKVQKHMSKETLLNRDLFNNFIVSIDVDTLVHGKNYKIIWDAAENMQKMAFKFDYERADGKYRRSAVLVTTCDHKYGSRTVELTINPDAVPVLLFIGEGYTRFQKTIAISLKSVYSKRMYELCNRWKDKAGFIMSLKEFKQTLGIEYKYKKISALKKYVLDTAQKELKQNADTWFDYDLKKVDSRSFNMLHFKVYHQEKTIGGNNHLGLYSKVVGFISFTYPLAKDGTAAHITDQILDSGNLDILERRLQKLFNEYNAGEKEAKDVVRLTKHILKNDYNIKIK